MFQPYLDSFDSAVRRLRQDLAYDSSWFCKAGLWPDAAAPQAAVFKLLKGSWSDDPEDAIYSTSGIFFSVWVDEEALRKGGLHYNLHALKLRHMAGYTLESRKFASGFRAAFGPRSAGWPGVKMAYGPQTLFQGFVKTPPARVEATVLALAKKFLPVSAVVDDLLASAAVKRPKPAALRQTMVV